MLHLSFREVVSKSEWVKEGGSTALIRISIQNLFREWLCFISHVNRDYNNGTEERTT